MMHAVTARTGEVLCLINWDGCVYFGSTNVRILIMGKRCRVQLKCDGTCRRTVGGGVKRKLANGVGSQSLHTTSEHGVYSIITADAHTSAASSRLNWRPPPV